MSTVNQLVKSYPRIPKKPRCLVPALQKCPQKRGTVLKKFHQSPKKPNPAKRKVARVRLRNGRKITCHVPGVDPKNVHPLNEHSVVLIRGGRCQDLIGVRYKPIRGKFDLAPVRNRVTRRSKYGVRRER